MRIESARTDGTPVTRQGSAFLADLSESVLRYLGTVEGDLEKQAATTGKGQVIDGGEGDAVLDGSKHKVFYPEGGLEAWLVVFGSWCGLFASIGMTNIMGSLQTYISTHQLVDYDEATIGWIFSLYAFLAFFCGVFVGPLFDKYGPRWLVLAGSVCVVTDMMLLGFCNSMPQKLVLPKEYFLTALQATGNFFLSSAFLVVWGRLSCSPLVLLQSATISW